MKTYNLENAKFKVSARMVQDTVKFPFDKNDKGFHNKFRVTVSTEKGKTSFDFFGSHNDWINGKTEMKGKDLDFAFYCFLSDSLSGDQSFEDFCRELGYDEDSRRAEKIHRQCQNQLEKAQRIFDCDLYDLINEFQEKFDC